MSAIHRCIAVARRRLAAQAAIRHLGWGLLAAGVAALLLAVGLRLTDQPVHQWYFTALAGAALIAAPLLSLRRRPTPQAAAVLIDERLGLKDRLATALYASRVPGDAFAAHVVHDAERSAAGLRLSEAFPVRLTRAWAYVPLLAALVLLSLWLVPRDPFGWMEGRRQSQARQALRARIEEARKEELVQAVAALQRIDPRTQSGNPDDLANSAVELANLTRRDLANPQTQREAAVKLSTAADKLDQAANQQAQELQPIQNAMSQVKPDQPGPADAFLKALQQGDFAAAMKALEDLRHQAEGLPADQRQALEQQLKNLAEQLAAAAQAAQMAANQQAANPQSGAQPPGAPQTQPGAMAQQNPPQTQPSGMAQQNPPQTQPGSMAQQNPPQTQPGSMAQQNPPQTQPGSMAQQNLPQTQPGQQQQQQTSGGQCRNPGAQGLNRLSQAMQQMSQGLNSRPGQGNQNPPNAQPGQNQFQNGAQQAQQSLQQFAQMQQALQQMRQAQGQCQQAMQNLSSGGGGNRQRPGQQAQAAGGVDSQHPRSNQLITSAGTAEGGNPLGQFRQAVGHSSEAVSEAPPGAEGRVIASWMTQDTGVKNAPGVDFNTAITQARTDAEKAVTDDRVPRRYHQAIKDYFNQLPATPEEVKKPAAPKAPE